MSRYSDDDEYLDSVTGVLKNLLGITDRAALEAAEADFVSVRATELTFSPLESQFDLNLLREVHRHLFAMCMFGQVCCAPLTSARERATLRIMPIL
jgi:fido (protein-threonine AMPylation protein)